MITKKEILNYRAQNPNKFKMKFGDADVDSLPDDGFQYESVAHVLYVLKATADELPKPQPNVVDAGFISEKEDGTKEEVGGTLDEKVQ